MRDSYDSQEERVAKDSRTMNALQQEAVEMQAKIMNAGGNKISLNNAIV